MIPALGQSWKQLSAEELNHAEVGVKLTPFESTQIDISVFIDQVKNRYIFGFPPNVPPPPQFLNLGTYVMRGAEIAIRQNITSQLDGIRGTDPARSQHRQFALYTKAGRHSGYKWADGTLPPNGRYPVSVKRPGAQPPARGGSRQYRASGFICDHECACIPPIAVAGQKRGNFRGHGKSSGCQLCLSPRLSHAGPLGADRPIRKLLIETDMAE